MTRDHVDLVSHWQIDAPVERVWAALCDPADWPHWWPGVRAVRTVRPGGPDGIGAVHRIRWATRLPCDLELEMDAIDAKPPEQLRSRSRGRLHGEGIWLLRAEAGRTDVTSVWRIALGPRRARWLLPLLSPVFRWSHADVMRAGEAGLARHLRIQKAV